MMHVVRVRTNSSPAWPVDINDAMFFNPPVPQEYSFTYMLPEFENEYQVLEYQLRKAAIALNCDRSQLYIMSHTINQYDRI